MHLLTYGNTKTLKGEAKGYLTAIMHLAPASLSGYNVCPMATPGCKAACLNTAGMGAFSNVQEARINKTRWFFQEREGFMDALCSDVASVVKRAQKLGLKPAIRLNGTSDIRWETIPVVWSGRRYNNIMSAFPAIQFYDYTKIANRRSLPANYHLTFSLSESNSTEALRQLVQGTNIAGVFRIQPSEWEGYPVTTGDDDDLRFLDPKGVVISLIPKGKAKKDTTGFVQ